MNNQAQDLSQKKQKALNLIFRYSNIVQCLMYFYGMGFIYAFGRMLSALASIFHFINFCVVVACAQVFDASIKLMTKAPPEYRKSKFVFSVGLCLLIGFAAFYTIAAVAISFSSAQEASFMSYFTFMVGFPQLLLSLIGLVIIKNFNVLMMTVALAQGFETQNQASLSISNGGGINDDIGSSTGGYAKVPNPFDQVQEQGKAHTPALEDPGV